MLHYFNLEVLSKLIFKCSVIALQIICIKCDYGMFEVQNVCYIALREGPTTKYSEQQGFYHKLEDDGPLTSEQQWFYCKEEHDGSFVIISVSHGKALKCDGAVYEDASLQVVLCDISDGDQWIMKENYPREHQKWCVLATITIFLG